MLVPAEGWQCGESLENYRFSPSPPPHLTNYFPKTTYFGLEHLTAVSQHENYAQPSKNTSFGLIVGDVGLFHLVPPSRETVDGNRLFTACPFPRRGDTLR